MTALKNLKPAKIWEYFEEICQIPRPSKKEEKIIAYLLDFGRKHQLETLRDEIGNVIMRKPATAGMENRQAVVMQSHIDMVCEKNNDVEHDFDNDPIQAYVDGEWVKARGTTLGGDDGIGMAAQMAVLTSTDLKHGTIEALFTVDEETGLTGASELQPNFVQSKILLNLDSEDEGELFIGCAGGIDTVAVMKYSKRKPKSNSIAFRIDVKGLKGGHSGDEIHKSVGNSNKILNRFLWAANEKFKIRLAYFDGGNLRNAIPREAYAKIVLKKENGAAFTNYFEDFKLNIEKEYRHSEANLNIGIQKIDLPDFIINKKAQKRLLNSLYACPHGVIAWSTEIEGLVETSTNLASVKFSEKEITITTSQRSSVDFAKNDIANRVFSVFRLAGAKVSHSDGYPGWKPNRNSEILKITETSYKKLFTEEPEIKAIHAGLECGLFLEKYPYLDMISFGPTIKGAHSPDERMNIETVDKFWQLLIDVLENIPKINDKN